MSFRDFSFLKEISGGSLKVYICRKGWFCIKIVLHHKCKTQLMERDTQCLVGFMLVTVMNQSTVVPLSLSLCCRFKCSDPL